MVSDFENQIDDIRVEIYERTKDLANNEAANSTNDNARRVAEQHGIKIVKGVIGFTGKNVSVL